MYLVVVLGCRAATGTRWVTGCGLRAGVGEWIAGATGLLVYLEVVLRLSGGQGVWVTGGWENSWVTGLLLYLVLVLGLLDGLGNKVGVG